jgi:hypothetical protein
MFDLFQSKKKKLTSLVLKIKQNPKVLHWELDNLLELVKKSDYDKELEEEIAEFERYMYYEEDKNKFHNIIDILKRKHTSIQRRRTFLKLGFAISGTVLLSNHLDTILKFLNTEKIYSSIKKSEFITFQLLLLIKNRKIIHNRHITNIGFEIELKKIDDEFLYFTDPSNNIFRCYTTNSNGVANVTLFPDESDYDKKGFKPVIYPEKEYSDTDTVILLRNYMKSIIRPDYKNFIDLCPIKKSKNNKLAHFLFYKNKTEPEIEICERVFNNPNYFIDIIVHEFVHYLDVIQEIFDYERFKKIYEKEMHNTNALKVIETSLIKHYADNEINILWKERLAYVIQFSFINFPLPSKMKKYVNRYFYIKKFPGLYFNLIEFDKYLRTNY